MLECWSCLPFSWWRVYGGFGQDILLLIAQLILGKIRHLNKAKELARAIEAETNALGWETEYDGIRGSRIMRVG